MAANHVRAGTVKNERSLCIVGGVPSTTDKSPARRSEARERLLSTASRLFYSEGINGVGVDRIVSASNVTLATFYRHFPSKQDLVVSYLQAIHDALVERAEAAAAGKEGRELIAAIGAEVVTEVGHEGFRGCAFINAASEFEDPDGPIMRAVLTHRTWFFDLVRDAFASAGHPQPDLAASRYVMLRDGATTAGHLGDPSQARETFDRSVTELLRFIDEPAETDKPHDRSHVFRGRTV